MTNENHIQMLLRTVQAKGEEFFNVDSEFPSMLTVSIFPTQDGTFQVSLVYSDNIPNNQGKYLDLPSWVDKSKWDYHDELYGEGSTLQLALSELLSQLDALTNLSKPKHCSQQCSTYWLVKDSNGQYYKHNENAIHWTQKQKDAQRFTCYGEAKKISDCLNNQHSVSRVIRIKGS